MKYGSLVKMVVIIVMSTFIISCQKTDDIVSNNEFSTDAVEDVSLKSANNSKGFVHGIVVNIDGDDYYFGGAPDGPGGAIDVPGHSWVQAGPNQLVGKHYNTGPFDKPQFWSSDAPDGEYLYKVHAIIDTWSPEKAEMYAKKGYVHYHHFISVDTGDKHPSKVPWLKHTARTSFIFDGGPHHAVPHDVTPGVDYEFMPNGSTPYNP